MSDYIDREQAIEACYKACDGFSGDYAENPHIDVINDVLENVEAADVIPCGYIRAKAYKATGPESVYLRKLLDDWEKEHEN